MYNVGDDNERPNAEIVRVLLEETGRDESFVRRIPDPRGGAHDRRYAMETSRTRALGWRPEVPFESGLRDTVRWYRENEAWWRPIVASEENRAFVARFYGAALGENL